MKDRKGITKMTYAIVLVAIIIVAAVGIAYYYLVISEPGARIIKIGVPGSLTGENAATGEDTRDAVLLAVEEINDAGGILGYQVEAIIEDVETRDAGAMTSVFTKLCDRDKVDAIINHWGNPGGVEYDIVEQYGIPYVVAGYNMVVEDIVKENPTGYPHLFSILPSYSLYGIVPAESIEDMIAKGDWTPINKEFALIMVADDYSQFIGTGIRDTLIEAGWTETFEETVATYQINDWSAVLTQIRQDPPALIINTMYTSSSDALFLKQFLTDPTPSLIYLQATPTYPDFLELTGSDSDGVIHCYSIPKILDTNPYMIKFLEKYGRKASPYGITGYDQVYLLKEAMELVGDPFDHDAVAAAIFDVDFVGVFGRYTFDPITHMPEGGGDRIPFPLFQMWDQESWTLYPLEVRERAFELPPWYASALEKYGP